jgi:cysteinyl-tRNA synthetase
MKLAEERFQARKNKDFAQSDKLRDQLKSQGWSVEDAPGGFRVKKL